MKHNGFTLIELMVIVAIIAILAAFAIPAYQQYIVTNAEYNAERVLLRVSSDTERWKAKALSYRGFPITYVSATGRYNISLADADVVGRPRLNASNALGMRWVAFAEPSNANTEGAKFMFFNDGTRCKLEFGAVGYASFDISDDCSYAGTVLWED